MKRQLLHYAFYAILGVGTIIFSACSSDNATDHIQNPQIPQGPLNIYSTYDVTRSTPLKIIPDLSSFNNPEITWTQTKYNQKITNIDFGANPNFEFITLDLGIYSFKVEVTDKQQSTIQEFEIHVKKEPIAFKSHLTKVYDFQPAYGQFVNKYPKYQKGDTKQTMIQKAQDLLAKDKPELVSLGGFGGYIEFAFDHSIINLPGVADFRVLGNAFQVSDGQIITSASSEPGIIMVGVDFNKNGKPDPDEWFEIMGSEHNNPKTIKNYSITYFKPDPDLDAAKGQVDKYIRWQDNQNNQGYKSKNASHSQSYFPLWIEAQSITFKGTLLPNNVKNNGNWAFDAFEYGYADNHPNSDNRSAIDIDWAVDKDGNKVHLKYIDFIRVYSALNQQAGILGETSTEVAGAIDLHLEQKIISTK
ncbi:cell surface protein [Myroides sp. LJL119]